MAGKIETMTDEECRRYYRTVRARSEADNAGVFDAAVKAHVAKWRPKGQDGKHTPQQWAKAAREVAFFCKRCAGTGQFVTYVENGQPKGPGGECFRCKGKGKQNDHDVRRNQVHDEHYCPGVI